MRCSNQLGVLPLSRCFDCTTSPSKGAFQEQLNSQDPEEGGAGKKSNFQVDTERLKLKAALETITKKLSDLTAKALAQCVSAKTHSQPREKDVTNQKE